jgi:hypothetical protein
VAVGGYRATSREPRSLDAFRRMPAAAVRALKFIFCYLEVSRKSVKIFTMIEMGY